MTDAILKVIKSPYLSLVVATLGLTILFAPETIATRFGLTQIVNNHIVVQDIPARTIVSVQL